MKKIVSIIMFLVVITTGMFASEDAVRNYSSRILYALKYGVLDLAEETFAKMEKEEDKEEYPSYYVCWFNYYYILARNKPVTTHIAVIEYKNGDQQVKEIKIPDPKLAKKGISYMDKAILRFPDRLDFYTSRHEVMKNCMLIDELIDSAEKMISRAKENKNIWYWEKGPYEDSFLGLMGECEQTLMYLFDHLKGKEDKVEQICDSIIEMYPKKSISYYFKAKYYLAVAKFDQAVEMFETALKIDPYDHFSAFYLGNVYEYEIHDLKQSLYWYRYAMKSKNEELKNYAKEAYERVKKMQ